MQEYGFMTMAMARAQVQGLEDAMRTAARPDLCAQLAGCYMMLGRQEESLRLYELAWQHVRLPEVAISYAAVLRDVGRQEEAGRLTEYACWADPDSSYGRLMHGETLLRAGLWRQAWPLYDSSRVTKLGERLRLNLPGHCREWDGHPLGPEEFLFVLMEGGAGDRINYARWVRHLADRAPSWKLFCYEPQAGLFLRLLGPDRIVQDGDPIPELSDWRRCWWTTVFSLPANFAAGPADVPAWDGGFFLRASDAARKKYQFARPADGLPLVGLCWEAGELSPIGDSEAPRVRSLTEAQAMRLVCQTADRVHWVSLQYGKKLAYPVDVVPFDTWEDTAGLLENLDCLLTVDTGPMHLAGAMRKPLGILLGTNSDWKFLAKGRCPFYRNAKLYRNGPGGGFENAINQAVRAIREQGVQAFG